MQKTIMLGGVLLGVTILAGCGQQSVSKNQAVPIQQPSSEKIVQAFVDGRPIDDQNLLEMAVLKAVNKATKMVWDKKIDIGAVDPSQKAAKGYWWAHDQWDWVAWQNTEGEWQVAVSLDGFECKKIDSIPVQFNQFFKDVLYQGGEKYCF